MPDPIEILAGLDPLAAYGAILGTAGTFLGLRQLRLDRPRLQFRLDRDFPDRADDWERTGDMGPTYVRLRVINLGRRPITIVRIGLELRLDMLRAENPAEYMLDRIINLWSGKVTLKEADFIEGSEEEDAVIGTLVYRRDGPYRLTKMFAVDASNETHRHRLDASWRGLGHEKYRDGLPERPPRSRAEVLQLRLTALFWDVYRWFRPLDE